MRLFIIFLYVLIPVIANGSGFDCTHADMLGGDCGNGAISCSAGYKPHCTTGSCDPVGDCMTFCNGSCDCDPSYKPADSVKVLNGSGNFQNIIAYCSCKKVTNTLSGSRDLFIPLKTSGEWLNFRTNAGSIPGISVDPGTCP